VEMVDHDGRWADRPLAPRCSTKSPQIPHGSRLLFSIWATLSCRPTPAPVRLKLYSSDGPDPARVWSEVGRHRLCPKHDERDAIYRVRCGRTLQD
jgi:hypothetical protein